MLSNSIRDYKWSAFELCSFVKASAGGWVKSRDVVYEVVV
jgi:hypothetical protein